jgi:hypothetical protein
MRKGLELGGAAAAIGIASMRLNTRPDTAFAARGKMNSEALDIMKHNSRT